MGEYDLSLRRAADQRPRDFLQLVLGQPVGRAEVLDPNLPIGELTADSLVLTDGGLLVHTEFQARWESDLAWRMLEYRILLRRRYGKRYSDVRSNVVLLTPDRYPGRGRNGCREGPIGRPQLSFEFDEIRLWEIPAEDLLNAGLPGLLPLVPLAQNARPQQLEEAVRLAAAVEDRGLRSDILSGLRWLSALSAFPEALKPMIKKSELYEMSSIYREDIDEAKRDGRQEGRQEGLRAAILRSLRRFPSLPADVPARLEKVASQERLEELFDLSLTCADAAAFLAHLPA